MTDPSITSNNNAATLRDCFSAELLKRITTPASKVPKKRHPVKQSRKKLTDPTSTISTSSTTNHEPANTPQQDAEDLAEFIDYLSEELFDALPAQLQTLSYSAVQATPTLQDQVTAPQYIATLLPMLPPSLCESLTAYALLPASTSAANLLSATLAAYISSCIAAPPAPSSTKVLVSGCEICAREWIPLTYHHLIPKSMHERVRKRGWHPEHELGNVAWLCRACHSYVHSIASNEVLARDLFTVEKLVEREDVRRWAGWVGRVRWKAK